MEGLKSRVRWLMIGMLHVECRQPVLHRVGGGKFTWAPNIDFTEWSSQDNFYVGDWLCKFLSHHKHRIDFYFQYNNLLTFTSNFLRPINPDFGFDKHIYNVLEVNKTSYDNCIDKDFIYNVTRGGRV